MDFYNFNGLQTLKYVYKYDENNNCIEVLHYELDGVLALKIVYIYDDRNNCIEKDIDNYNGLNLKITYKYDSKNRLVEETTYWDITTITTTYIYDKNGNLIEKSNDYEGLINKYDDKNNLIEELTYKYEWEANEKFGILKNFTEYKITYWN